MNARHIGAPALLVLGLSLFLACGGTSKQADEAPGSSAEAAAPVDQEAPAAESEGVLVAKEILAAFDAAVAEAAEAANARPGTAELKARVEAIFESHKPKMEELNARFLALRDKDIRLFGDANRYLGENRGRHVYEKDVTLGDALRYYNLEKGDQESAALLSTRLIELIEIAVKM
jgi:hypothetical protein